MFNSISVGLLLSQMLYWHGKGSKSDGWMYKTVEELKKETGLTRSQQETAIRRCKSHGLMETKLAGIPAKRHFRLDVDMLEELLPSLKINADVVYINPPKRMAENKPTTTEITHKTTSENTHTSFKRFRKDPSPLAAAFKQKAERLRAQQVSAKEVAGNVQETTSEL